MTPLELQLEEFLPLAGSVAAALTTRKGHPEEFDDARADALVGLWKGLLGFRRGLGKLTLRNYVLRRIRGEVLDGLRRRHGRHDRSPLRLAGTPRGPIPEARATAIAVEACRRRRRALDAAEEAEELLARLPPAEAELLADHYLRGVTLAELAQRISRSESLVSVRLKGIRSRLAASASS